MNAILNNPAGWWISEKFDGSHYRPGNFVKVKRLFPDKNRSQLD